MTSADREPTPDPSSQSATHLALYRRWRAQTFAQMIGQDAVVATLRNAVRTGAVSHALLFVGPRGTGKTSMARIIAKALNCTNLQDGDPCDRCPSCVAIREGRALDVVELDAATNNKVDDMRDLLERTWTAPSDLRRKVYVIDEVQRITQGWDVLLRTLEEPPDHVAFVFCTTDASQIRPAVLSRVQRFDFRRLTVPEIEGKLGTILAGEARRADADAVRLIARQAAGGMRDAESLLDQLLSSGADTLTVETVRGLLGLADADTIEAFTDALVRADPLAGIAVLSEVDDAGRDLGAFLDQVVDGIREALMSRLSGGSVGRPEWTVPALVQAARRLANIDASRPGAGGIRFQLELAVLASGAASGVASGTLARGPISESPTLARGPMSESPPLPLGEPETEAAPPEAAPPEAAPREAAPREAVPPPPAPAQGPPTGADVDGLRELDRLWPSIVADLSASPPIKPLIEVCRPIDVDGTLVTLGFPEGKAFLKDVAERRRATLEDGIGRALGHAVTVRMIATNLEVLPPPVDEEAERIIAAARRVFADDLVDAGEVT